MIDVHVGPPRVCLQKEDGPTLSKEGESSPAFRPLMRPCIGESERRQVIRRSRQYVNAVKGDISILVIVSENADLPVRRERPNGGKPNRDSRLAGAAIGIWPY